MTQHSTLTHPKYRPDIDGLRAVAVLSVLIFHAFPDTLKAGFIGVDVFFVISGFLISSIIFENLDHGTFSFTEFYARRIKRIFPALSLVLLSCLVFGWFGLLEDEYKQLGKHIAAGAAFISNFALWQESGYFDNVAETKPLLHLWSLAIEEQFYIVWPLLMWLIWKRKTLFVVTLIGLLIGSFAISLYLVRVDRVAAFYFPGSRVWQLLLGVVLAYLAVRPTVWQPSTTQRHWLSALGLALLALAAFKIDKNRPYPGSWALLPGLGTFLIIFAGSSAYINRFLLSNKWLVWVGLISFPLYLWHWPLLSLMRIVESNTPDAVYRVAALGLSFLLAWLTYRFVEKPIRSMQSEVKSRKVTQFLIALMVAIGLMGFAIHLNNGFASRVAAQADGENVWNNASFRKSCTDITNDKEQDDWCNMGNAPNKPTTTLVIGDSVGNGFAPMLQSFAERDADASFVFKQIGRGGCHGFPGIGMPHCEQLVTATDRFISTNPSINTIILASNWSIYSHGFSRDGLSDISGEQFKTVFEARIKHYQALGKRVIVFWAPPVGANPRDCVVRPIRVTNKTVCVFPRANSDYLEKNYKSIYQPLLASKGIATFDPVKHLCDEKMCKITDGSIIYYLDHAHFSIYGGQFLAKAAASDLKQLLAAP